MVHQDHHHRIDADQKPIGYTIFCDALCLLADGRKGELLPNTRTLMNCFPRLVGLNRFGSSECEVRSLVHCDKSRANFPSASHRYSSSTSLHSEAKIKSKKLTLSSKLQADRQADGEGECCLFVDSVPALFTTNGLMRPCQHSTKRRPKCIKDGRMDSIAFPIS